MKKNLICFFLLAGLLFPFSVLSQLVYHEGSSFPVYGKSRESTFGRYTRLPGSVADFARRPVWDLGLHSAGLAVRFRSNSTTISVRWTNTFCNSMNHMAPTGVRGLDLYAWVDGGWRFVNCARPGSGKTTESRIVSDMVPEEREYMLYLPLYDGIDSLSIGVDSCAMIGAPRLSYPVREHPIVFYGTSILQGGCSSRPGMAHTNILSRRLNREAINLGFGGNGQLDCGIAHLTAEVDAGVFVLDFVPNVTVEQIETKLLPFYIAFSETAVRTRRSSSSRTQSFPIRSSTCRPPRPSAGPTRPLPNTAGGSGKTVSAISTTPCDVRSAALSEITGPDGNGAPG